MIIDGDNANKDDVEENDDIDENTAKLTNVSLLQNNEATLSGFRSAMRGHSSNAS